LRTLVISDLHLGLRSGRDRVRGDGAVRERLLAELGSVDRLVLLGDLIELRQGPVREALADALPVLRAIGSAMSAGEIVLVAGNHDHHLLDRWHARRALDGPPLPLGTESEVDWGDDALGAVAAALASGGALVRAAYPGVWLAPRVWATHGHYLDIHTTIPMFERLGAGATARIVRKPPTAAAGAEDYEAVLSPLYAWLHATAQNGTPARGRGGGRGPGQTEGASAKLWAQLRQGVRRGGWRRWGLKTVFPVMIWTVNRAGLGPVRADINGAALRRAPLLALGEVVTRLDVDADYILFGHTHRAGPLPGDDSSEWRAPSGARLLNIGSWVDEPAFLGSTPGASPYRFGFAAQLVDDGPPELINLLD
jgi:predicted phosphodiesterase